MRACAQVAKRRSPADRRRSAIGRAKQLASSRIVLHTIRSASPTSSAQSAARTACELTISPRFDRPRLVPAPGIYLRPSRESRSGRAAGRRLASRGTRRVGSTTEASDRRAGASDRRAGARAQGDEGKPRT
eukprot:1665165-Pyramimonas_sp.AAC.1